MDKRIADAMFASAAGVLSTLVDRTVTAGPSAEGSSDSSIRVETDVVACITQIPSASFSFVTRFEKDDLGRVVELMLGTASPGGEMDAMQLSIVSETVLQIAGAMAEKLATDLGRTAEGLRTEVIDQTAGFPAPPYTVFAAPIDMGDTHTTVEICFDGQAVNRVEQATKIVPEPRRVVEPQPMPPPPRAQRPAPESRPASFATMTPTPVRAAAPGQANLDLVHDVPLQISAVLGRTSLSLRDVVALQSGSVFELDKLSTDPIDLYVNNILIARGEVVVVDDKFAVKISELNPNAEKS